MDSSESQSDLPSPQPDLLRQRPTSLPTITVQELDQQCQDLRTLLTATFVALLVLALSLNLFLAKQMRQVRAKVSESRPVIQRLQTQFREKEPNIKKFIDALQSFAAAHRDFQPVLEKYRYDLPQYLTPPAAGAAPPGIRLPATPATGAPPIQPALRPAPK